MGDRRPEFNRRPQWKMTTMGDDHKGRRPQWKTTSIEDNLKGRKPQWKKMSMKDNSMEEDLTEALQEDDISLFS